MNKQNCKYVIILGDGMADYPDKDGNTPLTLAKKPSFDALAKRSEVGLCLTVPHGLKPGSDVANLSVMGYDPRECYTGRSPLEAISIGIALNETDVTYRCNLVCLSDESDYTQKTMLDYSAGEITTAEAKELIAYLSEKLDEDALKLYTGVSYRHCLVRTNGVLGADLTPPHDISDRKITNYLPKGEYADFFISLMQNSYTLLKDHPVNIARIKQGKKPANSIWLWGEGKMPKLQNFEKKYGLRGTVISAVDLIKGIGLGAGMNSIDVMGATGTIHTNFDGKANAAIEALNSSDFVYLHLEAPDECGHQGDKEGKIRAIELIDEKVLKPVWAALSKLGSPYKLLVLPDHATPLALKTHVSDPVPYMLFDSQNCKNGENSYNEFTAAKTGITTPFGFDLLPKMLKA